MKELVAELAISQAKTDEKFAETEAQMARTDETLKRIGINLGGISDNNGSNTDDYFFNSLVNNPVSGCIKYDSIAKNFQINQNVHKVNLI